MLLKNMTYVYGALLNIYTIWNCYFFTANKLLSILWTTQLILLTGPKDQDRTSMDPPGPLGTPGPSGDSLATFIGWHPERDQIRESERDRQDIRNHPPPPLKKSNSEKKSAFAPPRPISEYARPWSVTYSGTTKFNTTLPSNHFEASNMWCWQ